ncbi:MAG: hypothetical protein IPM03_20505 [Sulfuritalea sp.]|nr:hypothetical protein [Sulfuritalea sp.]
MAAMERNSERQATPPNLMVVSALTRMEVDFGIPLDIEHAKKRAPIRDALISTIATLPFDEAESQAAAAIRATLKTQGQSERYLRCPDSRSGAGKRLGSGYIECRRVQAGQRIAGRGLVMSAHYRPRRDAGDKKKPDRQGRAFSGREKPDLL